MIKRRRRLRYRDFRDFVVKRKVVSTNAFNAEIVKWEKVDIIKGGHFNTISGEHVSKSGRMVESSTHMLMCNVYDVCIDDRIVVDGTEYKVNHVYNPLGVNHHLEIELETVLVNDKPVCHMYYGKSSKEILSVSDIIALDSREAEDKYLECKYPFLDEYAFVAYPKELGLATFRLNNQITMTFTKSEMVVNGVDYYVYRSEKLQGTYKIQSI